MLSLVGASESMTGQLFWTPEQGSEVSHLTAAICDAGFGRAGHVPCIQLATCGSYG